MTRLRCGGIFNDNFMTPLLLSPMVKEFRESINVWQSFGQEYGVLFSSTRGVFSFQRCHCSSNRRPKPCSQRQIWFNSTQRTSWVELDHSAMNTVTIRLNSTQRTSWVELSWIIALWTLLRSDSTQLNGPVELSWVELTRIVALWTPLRSDPTQLKGPVELSLSWVGS